MRRAASAGLGLLVAACASLPPAGEPLTGRWGGPHIGLTLTAAGGTLDYDCGAGLIGPVVPGGDGGFVAEGRHTPGTGGPEQVGEVRPSLKVRYTGRVQGERMTLRARVEDGVLLGPFSLKRGAEPGLMRCL